MKTRRLLMAVALPAALALLLAAALLLLAWHSLAAREGHASLPLRLTVAGRGIEQRVDAAVLLRAATHPLAASVIDGRSFDTAQGRWHVTTAAGAGALAARCEPCRFVLPALGSMPLTVERAELSLRPEGADRYRAWLALGHAPRRLVIEGRVRFDARGGMQLDARLPATALADAVYVLGRDLPERDRVQVHGTLALDLAYRCDGGWRVRPRIDGFEVHGLGTEQWSDLQRPAACRVDADGRVNALGGWLPRAVVAAEDARFFEHPGYDLAAMVDAWQHNQRAGQPIAGGSTLTQQLAKLVVTGDERSASRKLRELLYAVELERTLGKARILQLYLALAPWGEGVCGAERAVRVHLGQRDAAAVGPVAAAWPANPLPAPDTLLRAERAQGEVDHARVARVIEGLRPMPPLRREKALDTLPFWAPPGLGPGTAPPSP
jgi:Transglycosylase